MLGTFATAGIVAVFAHSFFGFDWTSAWIVGAALAPTVTPPEETANARR